MSEQKTHAEIIEEMRTKAECAKPYDDGIVMMLTDYADRLDAAHKREVDALKQRLAELDAKIVAKDEVLKRCAAFLGETIQCGVEGEMLDGRHVNVAASDLADDIDDLLKQRTEASHPEGREG